MLDFPYLCQTGFLMTVRVKLAPGCALTAAQEADRAFRPARSTADANKGAIMAHVDAWAQQG